MCDGDPGGYAAIVGGNIGFTGSISFTDATPSCLGAGAKPLGDVAGRTA